ncbi:MAG: hypothetical protein JWN94_1317 [Betaproteobacteria bacterium]|nr:hypothetical protein [Betaproteobacteria bacterium]
MTEFERRLFLRGITAATAGGLTSWIHQALAADPKSLPQGIVEAKGDVLVNGKPATKGSPVAPGDVVETGKGARAVYLIDDNAFMQRPNSRVEFGNSVENFLRLVTGGLLSVYGKGSRMLTTPLAAIGIRGTGCYIETDAHKTYFCLCFGAVDLQPVGGQSVSYETMHHEKPVWIDGGIMKAAGVVNHTDAEVIMLEALAGRRSPFPPAKSGRY